jgi:hypothetical protein
MRMEPPEVAVALGPAGLGLVCVVELPPYHYAAIFEKSGREKAGERRAGLAA